MTPASDASGRNPRSGPPEDVTAREPDATGEAGQEPEKTNGIGAESVPVGPEPTRETEAEVVEEDLSDVLGVARRERDEYLDMLRRVQADFENYKKRMIRQQTELLERAAQGIVDKLLPALDAFDLARAHLSDTDELSDEGKALLQASALLFDTLAKEGLEKVDDLGKLFDPTVHEAVEHDTSGPSGAEVPATSSSAEPGADPEAGGPVVVGVLRPGYRWKGRVIRPTMVKVRG